jgi:hypothetical protein
MFRRSVKGAALFMLVSATARLASGEQGAVDTGQPIGSTERCTEAVESMFSSVRHGDAPAASKAARIVAELCPDSVLSVVRGLGEMGAAEAPERAHPARRALAELAAATPAVVEEVLIRSAVQGVANHPIDLRVLGFFGVEDPEVVTFVSSHLGSERTEVAAAAALALGDSKDNARSARSALLELMLHGSSAETQGAAGASLVRVDRKYFDQHVHLLDSLPAEVATRIRQLRALSDL